MLPQKLPLPLMQTTWAQMLNPIIAFPPVQGTLLTNIPLINGVTIVNTLLGRKMQGWIITDTNAAATIYRSAAMNDKTLQLTSNAAVTVSIWVF